MLTITKEFSFHAAHRLHLPHLAEEQNFAVYGNCSRLHGHTYLLRVTLAGQPDETGMILHFGELKRIVKERILNRYDHADLSELPEYLELPATAENMAMHIFGVLDQALASDRCRLQQVTVFETATAWATWTREEGSRA
jgi:6-pyruvoyltetrahydropterin/6-carboxytetrahydropterin synthase